MDVVSRWFATNEGNGAGFIIVSLEGHTYEHVLKFMVNACNNIANY